MKTLIYSLLLLTGYSIINIGCKANKNIFEDSVGLDSCNRKIAELQADDFMKKHNKDVNSFSVESKEDSSYYFVYYLPKNIMQLGGGVWYKISKTNCKIVEGYKEQ